jgi:polar amino acid transport system permease protein
MFDFEWLTEYGMLLVEGLWVTVQLLLASAFFGFLLAGGVALARLSKQPMVALSALTFTQLIRGTPLLVQIFLLYYGLGSLFAEVPVIRESWLWPYLREGFWYIVLALVLSVGAYVGEVLRAGLKAVPRGEIEAARALGMPHILVIRRIWMPRAIHIMLPTLAGETVLLLKSTALASTVAVSDLLGGANYVRAQTLITYEPLLTIAVIYMVLAWLIERGFRLLESRAPSRTQP